MALPWQTIDKVDTRDGVLELRKRGDRDFLILVNNRVLMNSSANRSEISLGEQARTVAGRTKCRVLIGGLGMALTLRAVLDALPLTADVIVAELNPVVVRWCQGPLSDLTRSAAGDPRVSFLIRDVAAVIEEASQSGSGRFDAIIIDLYEGPGPKTDPVHDPFYGSRALMRTRDALSAKGMFAVWGEASDAAFEKRLAKAGFSVERRRPGRGGLRHVVYTATKE